MKKYLLISLLVLLLGFSGCSPFGEKPPESSPAETVPEETAPGEAVPAETGPTETGPGETISGETGPGETAPGETAAIIPAETGPDVMVVPAAPGDSGSGAPGPEKTEFGSAGRIGGKTVLVSIFASDAGTSWDFSEKEDEDTANDALNRLLAATDWLGEELEKFNVKTEFIADWREHPDLFYTVEFSAQNVVPDGSRYWDQARFAKNGIPAEELKQAYGAENIIYLFFYNTDFHNQVNSYTFSDSRDFSCDVELIDVFVKFDYQYVMPAASYAHEILHAFGAKDLYLAKNGITQEFVDYCVTENSMDIMFSVNDGPSVEREISSLDAYYIGILPECEEVSRFGLETSYYYDR